MYGASQSRIFAALLLDALAPPRPPACGLCARSRGDEILHLALAAAHRPAPPRTRWPLPARPVGPLEIPATIFGG